MCISEAPYAAREWQLPFVVLCKQHRILLLERCPGCLCIYRPGGQRIDNHPTVCGHRGCQLRLEDGPSIKFVEEPERLLHLQNKLITFVFTRNSLSFTKELEPACKQWGYHPARLQDYARGKGRCARNERQLLNHCNDFQATMDGAAKILLLLTKIPLTEQGRTDLEEKIRAQSADVKFASITYNSRTLLEPDI